MRGFLLLVLAAALGAVVCYGAIQWLGGERGAEAPPAGMTDVPEGQEPGSQAGSPGEAVSGQAGGGGLRQGGPLVGGAATSGSGERRAPALVGKPRFFQGDPDPAPTASPPSLAGTDSAKAPAASGLPPAAPASAEDTGAAAVPSISPRIDTEIELAKAAFRSGEKERGIRILRQVYAVAKDSPGIDLSSQVAILYQHDSDATRRQEYLQYLIRRDLSGRFFEEQMVECEKKLAVADTGAEAATDAWEALSLAYHVAANRGQKEKVLERLRPFLDKMIFSGRYSSLLKSYTVQSGDNLTSIAARFQTTADSLRRLNNLSTDTIQPRQRLRILPGRVKVSIDKSDFVLWATVDGRLLLEFPVGIGMANSTPVGTFVVDVRQKDPTWWRPGQPSLPPGDPRNILGTRWIGFKETPEYAGYGIHGTNDPSSLGKESSAGCVRLKKEDVELLYDFVGFGTEVTIQP